jgi:hypothetical protein
LALIAQSERSARPAILYAAALAVAVACLTRTIGISLFAPLIAVLLRRRPRVALLTLLIALLPMFEWHALHYSAHSYAVEVLGAMFSSNAMHSLLQQLAGELPALRGGFADNFLVTPELVPLTDVLALACIAAAALRVASLRADALYLAAYFGIILIWPYSEEARRFLWPVLPLLLAQPLLLARASGESSKDAWVRRQLPAATIATAILIASLPAIAEGAERFRDAAYRGLPDANSYSRWYDHDRVYAVHSVNLQMTEIASIRRIADEIPQNDCVLAIRPEFVTYFANRHSETPPLNSIPDPYFAQALTATGCRFAFMSNVSDGRFPDPMHPMQRLPKPLSVLDYTQQQDPPPSSYFVLCILAAIG